MSIEKIIIPINSPTYCLGDFLGNTLYVKREDLIPYCFGGNKARKAILFFEEIINGSYDCVVTYGSSHSNHCRVVANMCAKCNIDCYVISPREDSEITFNKELVSLFGAKMKCVSVVDVHAEIEETLSSLKHEGKTPYFIQGGGHGNIGTQAYVNCYEEIKMFERDNDLFFDNIFLASGTGTTQAGLVCGQIIHNEERRIVGISIARKNPRGRDIVIDSICDYLTGIDRYLADQKTIFIDSYIDGYAREDEEVNIGIINAMREYGIPMDATYTGKAFVGMKKYLLDNSIKNKNVLFIHTGGTPLYFDFLEKYR